MWYTYHVQYYSPLSASWISPSCISVNPSISASRNVCGGGEETDCSSDDDDEKVCVHVAGGVFVFVVAGMGMGMGANADPLCRIMNDRKNMFRRVDMVDRDCLLRKWCGLG